VHATTYRILLRTPYTTFNLHSGGAFNAMNSSPGVRRIRLILPIPYPDLVAGTLLAVPAAGALLLP